MSSVIISELPAMDATRFQQTPYYCEENVYLLCKTLCESGVADETGSDLFVVFISNERKQARMFGLCFVLLFHFGIRKLVPELMGLFSGIIMSSVSRKKESDSEPLVWDLDSTLPFPSPLASYVTETIQPSFQLFAEYKRFFRVVHAPLFFKHFASDRRHMKGPDGSWIAQPPPYQPIVAQDGVLHNLSEYTAMSATDTLSSLDPETVREAISQKLGVLVSHSQLQDLFTKLP
ncbi:hypothetical protein Bca4012_002451 [Brassica carinata]